MQKLSELGQRKVSICFSSVDRKGVKIPSHSPITESHCARFSFTEENKSVVSLDEGRAEAVFSPAADFTGVLRFWKQRREGTNARTVTTSFRQS